jgi:hypothetical protein
MGILADIPHPELATQRLPFRAVGRLSVGHHQAQLGTVESTVARCGPWLLDRCIRRE